MTTPDEPDLVIQLRGAGWRADLELAQPEDMLGTTRQFPVPHGRKNRIIPATVFYTEAVNRDPLGSFWMHWHVKIYRCATQGDTDLLRGYLRRQAQDIHVANAELYGSAKPISPPWSVVPVHIVRGDRHEETYDGTVLTELALPPELLYEHTRDRLPGWFADDLDVAARTLLAISPKVRKVRWESYRDFPGVEFLPEFQYLAAGLDTLHNLGTVHCDIRPDNVCQYNVPAASGFVLVDADAATRLESPPPFLRLSPPYSYGAVRKWVNSERHGQPGSGLNAGILRAQDRFGFALVVLSALAGKDWVVNNLLWEGDDVDHRRRRADHPGEVRKALRRLWPGTAQHSWEPLIEALAEPFDRRIEAPTWSAAIWVKQLLDVTAQPPPVPPPPTSLPFRPSAEKTRQFAEDLHQIQTEASTISAKVDQLWLGFEAVQRQAERVAWRAARRWTALLAVPLLAIAALLVMGAGIIHK